MRVACCTCGAGQPGEDRAGDEAVAARIAQVEQLIADFASLAVQKTASPGPAAAYLSG
jgi:hypothetical protein